MGCRPSKHASSKVRAADTWEYKRGVNSCPPKISKRVKTGANSGHWSSSAASTSSCQENTKFCEFSTTTATYNKPGSKTSKITVRLSSDGSTLEIEKCEVEEEVTVHRSESAPVLTFTGEQDKQTTDVEINPTGGIGLETIDTQIRENSIIGRPQVNQVLVSPERYTPNFLRAEKDIKQAYMVSAKLAGNPIYDFEHANCVTLSEETLLYVTNTAFICSPQELSDIACHCVDKTSRQFVRESSGTERMKHGLQRSVFDRREARAANESFQIDVGDIRDEGIFVQGGKKMKNATVSYETLAVTTESSKRQINCNEKTLEVEVHTPCLLTTDRLSVNSTAGEMNFDCNSESEKVSVACQRNDSLSTDEECGLVAMGTDKGLGEEGGMEEAVHDCDIAYIHRDFINVFFRF